MSKAPALPKFVAVYAVETSTLDQSGAFVVGVTLTVTGKKLAALVIPAAEVSTLPDGVG
jgi:hypothetical protein